MKRDLRYTPTDCFETFPFPEVAENDELFSLGERLKKCRRHGHEAFVVGLTELYNRFHDPEDTSPEITALREVHVAIDERTKELYGFDDIALEYGFHEVAYLPPEDRLRYTVSEKVRLDVLHRLAKLNRERYEEEQAAHQLPSKSAKRRKAAPQDSPLFAAGGAAASAVSEQASGAVLNVLRRSNRWHKKAEVLRESGISEQNWKVVIDQLVADGKVERRGEKRGTEYMVKR